MATLLQPARRGGSHTSLPAHNPAETGIHHLQKQCYKA